MVNFKTGRVLWNGREFVITEVEQITSYEKWKNV